jgi:uncharacterized protein YprB with RNaseH-like and TPR domain
VELTRKLALLRRPDRRSVSSHPAIPADRRPSEVSHQAIPADRRPSEVSHQAIPADRRPSELPASQRQRLALLRERLEQLSSRPVEPRPLEPRVEPLCPQPPPEPQNLPVTRSNTPHGTLYVSERRLDWEHSHGTGRLACAMQAAPHAVAELALDDSFGAVDPRRMLYLDTETTGLSAGAGILPFLIGVGFFADGAFRVEQSLLIHVGHEAPMLHRLSERLADASAIVTYNGKAFDWPLLRNRFVLNRMTLPEKRPHLDLLHCARRVFKFRLDSVRLVDVEAQVLDFVREGDVEGRAIPELYWESLRSGDGSLLAPVLEHNANDVIALAAMVGKLARGLCSIDEHDDARDRLGYALVAERNNDPVRALAFARAASKCEQLSAAALVFLATLERRAGNFASAAAALERALRDGHPTPRERADIHTRLAKLFEHQLNDLPRALEHAHHTLRAEGPAARERRITRLVRRIARA